MTSSCDQTYQEQMSVVEEPNYYNQRSEIASFYSGKKIFITGGLGFLGRLILEKLLRCCPEITMVYLLIRPKNQKDTQTRFKEYFNNVVFDRLKREQTDAEKKIVLIKGKMDELNLGLSEEDRERIKDTNLIQILGNEELPLDSTGDAKFVIFTKSKYLYYFYGIIFHWIPALFIDSQAYLTGKKPILLNLHKKIYKFNHVMTYFTTREWKFANDNVLNLWNKLFVGDKYNFFFNIADLDWDAHNNIYVRGLRIFIFKEPMETREKALIRFKKLKIVHYTLITLFCSLFLWSLYIIILSLY